MPLPTGYGLQVRGPDNESIVLPVCLPPGFELASMVLCPEFLPRDQPQPAKVAPPAAASGARSRRRRRARRRLRERLSGTLQYVFGSGDPGFSMDETFGGASRPTRRPAPLERRRDAPPRLSQAMTSGVATTGPATPLASTNWRTAR